MMSSIQSALVVLAGLVAASATDLPAPDIVVATDGDGDFTTIQAAVASIPATNTERTIVFIRDGVYREKVRVDAPFVTLRGESRAGTRIEFSQLNDDFSASPDRIGRAVINLTATANDFVLENLTAENTAGQIGPHAFTVFGRADRTVIVDCDVLSHGADTVSLWRSGGGRYYHSNCNFRGSVDFVCPRGWCYVTNCTFYEMKETAAAWHDGRVSRDMKFVLRDCRFDGAKGWNLARHHHDAQFYFLNCTFAETMIDRPPFRVIYPIGNKTPTEADIKRNAELDRSNLWGERSYFHNCHREGGDYAWMQDNLDSAQGGPAAEEITPAWTFAGRWNPEQSAGPRVMEIGRASEPSGRRVRFSENVTVKGHPRLRIKGGGVANYASGSGTDTLVFISRGTSRELDSIDLNGGAIIATEAAATIRIADIRLP